MRRVANAFLGTVAATVALAGNVPAAVAASTIITTAAGTGVAGSTGDGSQATSATLTTPAGVAVDGAGNVYIADDGANVVRKISTTGVISTVAGTGTAGNSGNGGAATSAKLNGPTDVALDAAGNLYIADFGNHVVREVLTTGIIRVFAGTGTAGYSGDGSAATSAKLSSPCGLDIDTSGDVFIADYGNGTVRKVTPSGVISTVAGTGVAGFSGDGGAATSAQLDRPGDVATVGSAVYIADGGNARVRVVDGSGTISTYAGNGTAANSGDGGQATSASLIFPTGLASDSSGNLFISDFSGQTIREVVPAGTISTVAGTGVAGYSGDGGSATSAELDNPARVNLDAAGDLYISDWSNHRVRKVASLGTPATVPGAPTGVAAVAGDGQATVSWSAPASDGGSAVTGYTVTPNNGTANLTPISVSAGSTSTTVTGLVNGTGYTFTVTATNTVGTSVSSAPSSAVTPAAVPGAPTGVSAVPGNAQATVSWSAPASDGGSAITGYTVTPNDGTANLTPIAVTAPSTSTTVTGLTNTVAYTFTVTATNSAGTSAASSPSTAVTPTAPATAPDAPTGVAAVAGDGQATVSWSAPASDGGSAITDYTVTPNNGASNLAPISVTAPSTSTTVTGLNDGTAYTFTVTATNSIGTSVASAPSVAVTPSATQTVAGSPTGVSAVAGDAQATVSWSAPASDGGSAITTYTVTPNNGAANLAPIAVTAPATSATVTGLVNGTSYTFTVTATNSMGTSAPSAPSSAVTPATVPGAPTGVSAVAGDGQATVSWSAPASDGGSAITGYTVTPNNGTANLAPISVTAPATSTSVTGLTDGVSYTFRVTATNAIGSSAASSSSAAVTPTAPASPAPTPTPTPTPAATASPTAPGAPTGVTAVAGNAQATVSWSAPASDGGSAVTGYSVTPNDGTSDLASISVNAPATSATVTGLTNGRAYTFTVTALNAVGPSLPSAPSDAVTPATVPDAPSAVSATSGDGVATVSWSAPAHDGGSAISGYTVVASGAASDVPSVSVAAGLTSVTITGLTNGTAYTFTVTATNSIGTSPPSSPSSAVTPAAPAVGGTQSPGSGTPAAQGGSTPSSQAGSPAPPSTPAVAPAAQAPISVPTLSTTAVVASSHPHHSLQPARKGRARQHHLRPAPQPSHRPVPTPPAKPRAAHHHAAVWSWSAVRAIAYTASKHTAVPAVLLLLIGLFLSVQNRLDRRDPKLRLAPVYADPGVPFVAATS